MSFPYSLDPNKEDNPYHPFPPESESLLSPSSAKVLHQKDGTREKGISKTTSLEDIEDEGSSSSFSHRKIAPINRYVLAGAILASTNSVLLGYDIGVMSGAVLFIKEDMKITSTQVEILVGSLNVCSLIGSLASGKTSDWIGRRYTIILAAATFLIGAILMGLAPSYSILLVGRLIAGIGVGYSLMIAPVYVAELSPTLTRGFLTSLPEVFINIGILLGYISNYALSGLPETLNWRLMLGLAAVPAVVVAIGVLAMPESPRWLVMRGRRDEARKVLIKTSETKEEAELRLKEIVEAASFSLGGASSSSAWQGEGVWKEMIFRPSRQLRRILIAAIGVNFFMQASGNDAVVYYSPEVFRDAGIANRRQQVGVTVIMGLAKTSFVLISAFYLDKFGRRPLLLLGSIGMALSLAGLGLGSKYLQYSDEKPIWAIVLCVVAVCSAVSFFSIGLGPITWVYSSEIFPMKFRAQGSSLAISVNRLNMATAIDPQLNENTIEGGKSNKPGMNKYTLLCGLLASTSSILLGYDIGVMSGAVLFIKENLKITSTQVEILVGTLNVFSLIGSLASGKTSDYIGRRYTIVLAATTFLIGALLMGLAPSFPFLLAGRVVAGIGVGYALMIAPLYTAELSPALSRGFLTSLPEVFITFGILIGYIFNYALSGLPAHINWRLMLGLAAVPAIGIGLGVMVMPESPRWLAMKGRLSEAKQVLGKISSTETEAELRYEEIVKAAGPAHEGWDGGPWVWKELLLSPSRPIRRMVVAAIGLNFFMQASGNDAVIYYCPEVFKAAGIHEKTHLFGVNVIMGLAKTSFVLFSALYLDKFGRRPLLLLGSAGMAISLAGLGLGSKFMESSSSRPTWALVLCIVAVCADVSFFSIGLGPVTWVYSSEIFPTRLRAQGTSLAISVNRLVSGAVSMTFLTISKEITFGGMFFVLGGVMVVATLFFFLFLPETKGKTLEEMETIFEDRTMSKCNNYRSMEMRPM
ncbi:hypothetical protein F8388_012791 [Cannabis sativa]|uniref:Major facilitator superfamily (MFS) profile domain-containing protein n=1 Tax=Cannabis sativa TaxID=3483 RepID=A0A7J6F480_CANSA|nr:hypothetical protein F8388_012791 [Cannabis sativa]